MAGRGVLEAALETPGPWAGRRCRGDWSGGQEACAGLSPQAKAREREGSARSNVAQTVVR